MTPNCAANAHPAALAGETRKTRRRVRRREPESHEPAAPPESPEDLLRPRATCPRCGARPALRIARRLAQAVTHLEPDDRVGSYQCQRRGCGAIYDLTASAYTNAT